jgi:hypothetical protein
MADVIFPDCSDEREGKLVQKLDVEAEVTFGDVVEVGETASGCASRRWACEGSQRP